MVKALPALLAAALCCLALHSASLPRSFLARQLHSATPEKVLYRHCGPADGRAFALAEGTLPAIVSSRPAREGIAAHYKVTLQTPDGEKTFRCSPLVYILDQAEEDEIELPYSCRSGSCSTCVGKVIEGTVDQRDQSYLSADQMAEGYCLTCLTYPQSDVVIKTHCEDELL